MKVRTWLEREVEKRVRDISGRKVWQEVVRHVEKYPDPYRIEMIIWESRKMPYDLNDNLTLKGYYS